MASWITPVIPGDYKFSEAYKKFKLIDWHRPPNVSKGDIIYFYFTKPVQAICAKGVVIKDIVPEGQVIDDSEFWTGKEPPQFNKAKNHFRVDILKIVEYKDGLGINELVKSNLGFTKYIQGSGKILNKSQNEYLEKHFGDSGVGLTEISKDEAKQYVEGAATQKLVNAYERDDRAKRECLKYFGKKCQVCGKDFIKEYGEMGEGCIEVHHLKPLSKIKKEYKVDPIKDLIPVCRNCHALIHAADNNNKDVSTLDKIKKIILK